ncbi:two-component sensor histidine kinase [Oceanobacillus iheyensis HTE831]|uniref:histidine kinase n=1 Tax=Oceanobacillus iheyensis (strain DSM 14371 / CIP 107618 / JCM 11309 / KCTC 3954 / HTE831) TaxID=221109 RepID=Q8EQ91_OCEIH|nr:ATP-binding protein [Oceanobacillus iheyensis]BAC13774.1 two-component sensor histidine kinase [Oceanobacillus iheyensis HTE831]
MFWKSVVGKLSLTILLLVSFVLCVLTFFLMQFFDNYHIQEAENEMEQMATKISSLVETDHEQPFIEEVTEMLKDPSSRIAIMYSEQENWISDSNDENLQEFDVDWIEGQEEINTVIEDKQQISNQFHTANNTEVILVGAPIDDGGAVFVYKSLDMINQTKDQTTKLILLSAGIAILLTTFFAVFLSTRITSPLIKMKEAAHNLTRGEFNTKVPVLTRDEIGELAIEFNRMGRQLNYHINALRQEKEQLSSIVSSMADGVFTLNREGEVLVINPPAKKYMDEWFYENPDESEGQNHLPTEVKEALLEVITKEYAVLKESAVQGRSYVMLVTPLYDESHVRGCVAVIRDMTEERRLDKLRKDFIANVSHELRTPISMLQGYSEAIVDDVASSKEEKNELAQIIYEESLRMGRLVNELLDLARMEAGQIQLRLDSVAIQPFIERIVHKFQGISREEMVELELTVDIEHQIGEMDPDRIEQVLTNLIDNAIRHTSNNGFVKVLAVSNQDKLYVEVKDSGSGIPEEDLPFIFERFYKADKSRVKKEKQGTGLGLAIAKNIIDAHHGSIYVKSKLDAGTTFSFEIPIKQN